MAQEAYDPERSAVSRRRKLVTNDTAVAQNTLNTGE